MKLEIELDLNKIDYDAINKQIQNKIKEMDLNTVYSINSKINNTVRVEVESEIESYFRGGAHGEV